NGEEGKNEIIRGGRGLVSRARIRRAGGARYQQPYLPEEIPLLGCNRAQRRWRRENLRLPRIHDRWRDLQAGGLRTSEGVEDQQSRIPGHGGSPKGVARIR